MANVVFQSLIHELPAQHSQMHTLVASADWSGDSGCSRLAKQSSSSSPLIALCREGSAELCAVLKVARCAMSVGSGEGSVSELSGWLRVRAAGGGRSNGWRSWNVPVSASQWLVETRCR